MNRAEAAIPGKANLSRSGRSLPNAALKLEPHGFSICNLTQSNASQNSSHTVVSSWSEPLGLSHSWLPGVCCSKRQKTGRRGAISGAETAQYWADPASSRISLTFTSLQPLCSCGSLSRYLALILFGSGRVTTCFSKSRWRPHSSCEGAGVPSSANLSMLMAPGPHTASMLLSIAARDLWIRLPTIGSTTTPSSISQRLV